MLNHVSTHCPTCQRQVNPIVAGLVPAHLVDGRECPGVGSEIEVHEITPTPEWQQELRENVARGGVLLDDINPSWFDKIDVDTLDISDCEHCTAAQLGLPDRAHLKERFGISSTYWLYVSLLVSIVRDVDQPDYVEIETMAQDHGFTCSADVYVKHHIEGSAQMPWLRTLWVAEIMRRRQRAEAAADATEAGR